MPLSIDQQPLYTILPIGQQVIFAVSEAVMVATTYNVKFIAEVHVSDKAINISNDDALIGTFKTTPNNAGVGIFDLRPILETFVSPDHDANNENPLSVPQYKGSSTSNAAIPLHIVDKFSISTNSIKYFAIRFKLEYSGTPNGPMYVLGQDLTTDVFTMFNGVLQYDDTLAVSSTAGSNDFGYPLFNDPNFFPILAYGDGEYQFLTNSPRTQYARLTDYGTLPFLNFLLNSSNQLSSVTFKYYWDGGSSTETVDFTAGNGGSGLQNTSKIRLGYVGAFPANLKNWSSTFATAVTNGLTYYTVKAVANNASIRPLTYTINILCPNEKGYEGISLTWLNKWGTWDYYTFNMKSTRSITTNRTSYSQLGGTWNESTFKISGYKGGKKNFRVNSTEKIKLNTGFVTEADGVWFEQLINSSEVYVLEGFQTDITATGVTSIPSLLNNYVQPARITNSSYIRKTIANDKLMQYTFEIEKSKMQRTQAV